MNCELVIGIPGSCDFSVSGNERLWFANKSAVTGTTYNVGGELTGMTFTSGQTFAQVFFEFVGAIDSITYNDDLAIAGSRRNLLHTINFAVTTITPAIQLTLETLDLANVVGLVKTGEGYYKAFGIKGPGLRTTVSTESSGTNSANDGAVGVTVAGSNRGKASFLDDALVASFGI